MRVSHVCRLRRGEWHRSREAVAATALADAQDGVGHAVNLVLVWDPGCAEGVEGSGAPLARRVSPLLLDTDAGGVPLAVYEGQLAGSHVRLYGVELSDGVDREDPAVAGRAALALLASLPAAPEVLHLHGVTGIDCDAAREALAGPAIVQSVYGADSDEPTLVASIADADAVVVPCSGLWESDADPVRRVAAALASHLKVYRVNLGLDEAQWNPAIDPYLAAPFDATRFGGKARCRADLLQAAGLPARPEVPLLAIWPAPSERQGRSIVAPLLSELRQLGLQMIVVPPEDGAADDPLVRAARELEGTWVAPDGSPRTVHRILGGCDAVLLPDRDAVLGLRARAAMRYANLVVARRVHTHRDVLVEVDVASESGGAFLWDEDADIFHATRRLTRTFADSALWTTLSRANAMVDWGWSKPLALFDQIYQKAATR